MDNLLILLWQLASSYRSAYIKFQESLVFVRDKISFHCCVTSQHGRKYVAMPPQKILINLYINFHVIEHFKCRVKSSLLFPTHQIILRGYLVTGWTE